MTSNKFTRKEGKERGERVPAPSTQSVYKRTFGWLDLNDPRHLIVVFMLCFFFVGSNLIPCKCKKGPSFTKEEKKILCFYRQFVGRTHLFLSLFEFLM